MRVKFKRPRLVHAIGQCSDCEFYVDDLNEAVMKSRYHALNTGHTVTVETGYAQIYTDKKD